MTWARMAVCLLLPAGAALLSLPALAGSPPENPPLHILSDRVLPAPLGEARDVRWASDRTVYLALGRQGTVEAALSPDDSKVVEMIPGASQPGGIWLSSRVAASPEYVAVAAAAFTVTWRTVASPLRREEAFDVIDDIDVWKDRLLVAAARRNGAEYAPEGGILWLGSLAENLADLRPVLFDGRGPGAPNLNSCPAAELGRVRFLADGSFLSVPGVQPGAFLYSPESKLLNAWDTTALGLDSDCAAVTKAQAKRLSIDFPYRLFWINQRRLVDEILPLAQGPGLVVRRVKGGHTRWQLKVLRRGGGSDTYDIPIRVDGDSYHLNGDVRDGRVVFVVHGWDKNGRAGPAARLVIAELPRS